MSAKAKVSVGYLEPGTVATCFMHSYVGLLFFDKSMHQRIVGNPFGEMDKPCGAGGIVDGRNELAAALLDDTESDWLFMVDSDMSFEPDIVERLIEAAHAQERPVVGALAFAHKKDGKSEAPYGRRYRCVPTVYDYYEDDTSVGFIPRMKYERNELVKVGATGGACVLIHRLALEAVRDKFGDMWFDTIRHPKGAHFSEDLAFCVRLAACGIPTYVHTGIKTGHDKGGVFYDEAYFDHQEAHREES